MPKWNLTPDGRARRGASQRERLSRALRQRARSAMANGDEEAYRAAVNRLVELHLESLRARVASRLANSRRRSLMR